MGKHKFISKKKSATFQLLARDTSDPNYSAGLSGDRVFVRVDNNQYKVDGFSEDEEPANNGVPFDNTDSVFDDAPEDYYESGYSGNGALAESSLPDHVRREILELGFPDDGYNYLMHLREIKNSGCGSVYYQNPKAQLGHLPADVKAYNASRLEISRVENESNEKSMYAVASKTPNAKIEKVVDDDIAALLDDSNLSQFGSDTEDLEEDFVLKANLPEGPSDLEFDKKLRLLDKPEVNREEKNDFAVCGAEETVAGSVTVENEKPRVRRPLDEQFDLLELQEYGSESDDDYGVYDDAEEDACEESLAEKLNHALKGRPLDGLNSKYAVPSDLLEEKKELEDLESPECAADVIERCREYAEKYENESVDEKEVIFQESSDESEVWDCETIVSTYSNLDNHPGKIGAPETRKKKLAETIAAMSSSPGHVIALKGKQKLPVDFLPTRKHSTDTVKDTNGLRPEQTQRKQRVQETKEEKKERKAAVKEERREARRVKKELKGLYKCEANRAQKVAAVAGPSLVHLV